MFALVAYQKSIFPLYKDNPDGNDFTEVWRVHECLQYTEMHPVSYLTGDINVGGTVYQCKPYPGDAIDNAFMGLEGKIIALGQQEFMEAMYDALSRDRLVTKYGLLL